MKLHLRLVYLFSLAFTALAVAAESRMAFDVSAGDAAETLKRFAQQAGQQVVYPAAEVRGVTTNQVKGDLTVQEGLTALLTGTTLTAVFDENSRTFAIKRVSLPNGSRAAQTTASVRPAPENNPEPAVVTLSPFQVTSTLDTGYQATNTLDGGRLNTALRDTPAAIGVFTKDFMADIGATDIQHLLRYDINAAESSQDDAYGATGSNAGNIGEAVNFPGWRIRGLIGSISTDGFRTAGAEHDTYNMDRVSSARGPNAILFGTGAAGGTLSFRTRTAEVGRNSTGLEFKVAEFGTRRASLDVNRVLVKDKLAVRVMGLVNREGSYKPYQYTDKDAVTLSAQYKIARETSLKVSYERNTTFGVTSRPWSQADRITKFISALNGGQVIWNVARERYETPSGAVVGAAAGAGQVSDRTVLVYGPELSPPPTLWEGTAANASRVTLATSASIFNGEIPSLPESITPTRSISPSGPGEYGTVAFNNFTALFTHQLFEKTFIELGYNRATRTSDAIVGGAPDLRADLDYRLPNGALNPYSYRNGYYFSEGNSLRNQNGNDNETVRASLSYELDLGRRWGNHRFAAMIERNVNVQSYNRLTEVWANRPYGGSAEAAANKVIRRHYFLIDGPYSNYTRGYNPVNPFALETYDSAYLGSLQTKWVPTNARFYDDKATVDSFAPAMQNFFFDRRLVTTAGFRFDRIKTFGVRVLRDAATQEYRFASASDQATFAAQGNDWFTRSEIKNPRRTVGAVLHVTNNFSLTANASSGVELPLRNRTVLPNDEVPDPFKGVGRDYGVSFSFLDNKYNGSLKYFESSSQGQNANGRIDVVFGSPNNDVMASFDYYLRQAGVTSFGSNDPLRSIDELRTSLTDSASSFQFDSESKGYEFEFMANPTRNWTIRLNYFYTDFTKTNVMNEGVGWWADRVAFWKQLDGIYTSRTGLPSVLNQRLFGANNALGTGTVADRIADSDRFLAEARAQEEHGFGNRPHKINLWTRYTFPQGFVKGLAVGGGWRYQSENIAGVNLLTQTDLHGSARSLFDFLLQYKSKSLLGWWQGRVRTTYQLNVENLLGADTLITTTKAVDTVTQQPYFSRGYLEAPRMTSFTVRFDL